MSSPPDAHAADAAKQPAPPLPDGLPLRRAVPAYLTVVFAILLSGMAVNAANVILPTIAHDLGASPAASIWIVTAYQLSVFVTLLPWAALGEIIGLNRVYLIGIAIFALGSLACALAPTLPLLAAGRAVQGLGMAGIVSLNVALVRYIVPRAYFGQFIGFNVSLVAIASMLGPAVAGAMLSFASWPWIFGISVPLGLAAVALGLWALPQTPRSVRPFDFRSAFLIGLSFGPLVLALNTAHNGEPWLPGGLAVFGLVMLAVLIRRQIKLPAPMLALDLMRRPMFSLSLATSILTFSGQALSYVALPFLLQTNLGFPAVATALLILIWPAMLLPVTIVSAKLADHYPAGILCAIGCAIFAIGLILLATLEPGVEQSAVVWRILICGLGFGLFQPTNNRAIIMAAPEQRGGAANGMMSSARQLGQNLGAASAGMFLALGVSGGAEAALFAAAFCAVAGALMSISRLKPGVN